MPSHTRLAITMNQSVCGWQYVYLLHNHLEKGSSLVKDKCCYSLNTRFLKWSEVSVVCLSSCWNALRPAVVSTAWFWSGVPRHWRSLWRQGPFPQALTLFGGVRLITWHLRHPSLAECRRDPQYFSKFRTRVDCGPAPRTTLKRPCAIHIMLVGRKTNHC